MSGTLLSPRMAGLLERIRRAARPPFHTLGVPEARAAYQAAAEVLDPPRAPLPRVEDFTLPAADGHRLRARLYAPAIEPGLPVMLYLHGGGFTIGNLETHDSLCRQIALRSGAAVVALDYRLAPEHRFPCAVDDCWTALQWLATNAASLGLDGSRLAVGGDSAGGTLAAVTAIHARDVGLPLRAQVLITPGTTAYADTPSHWLFAEGFLLDAASIAWFFDHYIPQAQRSDWRFAPLNADDVDGLAPACVVLAECDPLVDEGLAYADKLRAAGVAVELELYRGLTHDFIKMGRVLPEASAAQSVIAAALRSALFPTPGKPMKRIDFRFFERLRVRWSEIDAQQIVFNGHYLMYIDTAVAGLWRAMAMPYHETMAGLSGDLYVRKATLEYHRSARYEDQLDIGIRCARIGTSSMTFSTAVFKQDDLLVSGELVYVFADPATQTSRPVPDALREAFRAFDAGEPMTTLQLGPWSELSEPAQALRSAVFVEEQRIPADLEWDAADAGARHVVAFNRFGKPVATGRLLQPAPGVGQIGRMAVHQAVRGSRVGRAVLDALVALAGARGDAEVLLHAQTSAMAFYARAGFSVRGEVFEEAGIPHIEMVRTLTAGA